MPNKSMPLGAPTNATQAQKKNKTTNSKLNEISKIKKKTDFFGLLGGIYFENK